MYNIPTSISLDRDGTMASVRVRGVSAKVDDSRVLEKAKQIREIFGNEYKIIIEKGQISIEGNIPHDVRKRMDDILTS